ncbi:MAG: hypothetical protein IJL57_00540 [Bacteroidales bacterium]|nr:hypothetical protein [Bacteroidales bacterium]
MKKEIGSEFWTGCSPCDKRGCEWSYKPEWSVRETLSGRVALEYIVEELVKKGKTSVYMPSYCCHTMIEPFLRHGVKVLFYDVVPAESGIKRQFDPDHGCDVVFLLDYFGFVDAGTSVIAKEQHAKGKLIIYDATHSLYSDFNFNDCDYVFGSYRKWMDVNCGFVGVKDNTDIVFGTDWKPFDEYTDMRARIFDLKSRYMNDEDVEKQQFLTLINEAEEMLEQNYHHTLPDQRSFDVLRQTDCRYLVRTRRNNALILMQSVLDLNDERIRCLVVRMDAHDTPLFVPVYIHPNHRNALRCFLIEHSIYCPVHWPLSDLHAVSKAATEVYDCELSLLCDQRYDDLDMYRIVETIKEYLKK